MSPVWVPPEAAATSENEFYMSPVDLTVDHRMSREARMSGDGDDEAASFLTGTVNNQAVPKRVAHRLYLSHALSTWNSRMFEFGAVLFLATIYPGTLTQLSIYAFTRGACAMVFAPAIGQYIDSGDRLNVVRVSIVAQRLVVATSCALFLLLTMTPSMSNVTQDAIFIVLVVLACIETLSSIMNLVSVEKDWCVVVARDNQTALRELNAQMRRIDLFCKLFGPLFIASVDGVSTKAAIMVNFAMNVLSLPIEHFAIARVYREVPELQRSKPRTSDSSLSGAAASHTQPAPSASIWTKFKYTSSKTLADFRLYLRHDAFLPSVAEALLYCTVLNFGGQMVTFMLASGYQSGAIGILRTVGVIFEVIATWFAPWLIGKMGPVRAGLWLSNMQVLPLIGATAAFFLLDSPVLCATVLVAGTIVSRLGLRGFDLSTQLIVQEVVEAESRGAFSTVEAAWQNMFELLSFATTLIFYKPEQFRWPALISVVAVALASFLYMCFAWRQRGHLIHLDKLAKVWASSCGPWQVRWSSQRN